jgi:hypothetical protein
MRKLEAARWVVPLKAEHRRFPAPRAKLDSALRTS